MTESRINNPRGMKQLVDFKGLELGDGIYPTDIDGIIEYKDSEYIIFEIKYHTAEFPLGQRLALQRMVDDFARAGKEAVAFVCDHFVDSSEDPVVAARCKVREIYYGRRLGWRTTTQDISLQQAVISFQEYLSPSTVNAERIYS